MSVDRFEPEYDIFGDWEPDEEECVEVAVRHCCGHIITYHTPTWVREVEIVGDLICHRCSPSEPDPFGEDE